MQYRCVFHFIQTDLKKDGEEKKRKRDKVRKSTKILRETDVERKRERVKQRDICLFHFTQRNREKKKI
jgi:hypothetical protein